MDEQELFELLENYKMALQNSLDRIDQLEEKVRTLESGVSDLNTTFYKEILEPAQQALDESMYNDRFDEFSEKYGERLDPLAKQVNAIEGEDGFDFTKEAFDNYDKMEPDENGYKPTSDEYVETLVSATEEKIEALKKALGAEEVSVTVDDDGETEVKADGEDVTEEVTDDNGEIKSVEEIETTVSPIEEEEKSEPNNPDDIAELEKALEEEAKRFK